MRTSGPSQQRSLLLPPLVTALGLRAAGSVQTCNASFASFSKLASLASFASIVRAERAVLALECKDSSVVSKVFEMRRRFFPKSLRTFVKIWVLPKKRKSRMGVKIVGNHTGFCGGPRGGRWITAEGFSSSPIFGESFGRPADFSADKAKPYNL